MNKKQAAIYTLNRSTTATNRTVLPLFSDAFSERFDIKHLQSFSWNKFSISRPWITFPSILDKNILLFSTFIVGVLVYSRPMFSCPSQYVSQMRPSSLPVSARRREGREGEGGGRYLCSFPMLLYSPPLHHLQCWFKIIVSSLVAASRLVWNHTNLSAIPPLFWF